MKIDPTPENALKYGLSLRQIEIVSLIERRFNRAAIAAYLGISTQSVRDIAGGLCDHYGCSMHDLPWTIQKLWINVVRNSENTSTEKGQLLGDLVAFVDSLRDEVAREHELLRETRKELRLLEAGSSENSGAAA